MNRKEVAPKSSSANTETADWHILTNPYSSKGYHYNFLYFPFLHFLHTWPTDFPAPPTNLEHPIVLQPISPQVVHLTTTPISPHVGHFIRHLRLYVFIKSINFVKVVSLFFRRFNFVKPISFIKICLAFTTKQSSMCLLLLRSTIITILQRLEISLSSSSQNGRA